MFAPTGQFGPEFASWYQYKPTVTVLDSSAFFNLCAIVSRSKVLFPSNLPSSFYINCPVAERVETYSVFSSLPTHHPPSP